MNTTAAAGFFSAGFLTAIAVTLLLGGTIVETRDFHRRACVGEFAAARSGRDSVLVIVADGYCRRFARGEGGPKRRPGAV